MISSSAVPLPEVSERREIVAPGSSKWKVEDTVDEEFCTSAHKVASIDDLLIKILTGLPLSSLRLSKSVCKRWSSLITDPFFNLLRSRNPNADHPRGMFLQLKTASSVFAFLQLDSKNLIKRSPSITPFPFSPKSGYIEVLHSCNGLILCHEQPDKLYVYNPTLNRYKLLPLPHIWCPNRFVDGMALAFDPKVSPHYKILYPHEDLVDLYIPVHVEIYSSETGNWRVYEQTFSLVSFMMFGRGIVYWRDAIHWMDNCEVYHFSLDLENPHFVQVDNHRVFNGAEDGHYDKLLVSCGCLLLVKMVHPRSFWKMNVYEMKNDYCSGWSFKYHVDLERAGNFNLLPGPNYNVLSVLLGKNEEDSFLVLEVTGFKLLQYNIFSKTLHELCDLGSIQVRDKNLSNFLFTLSLAGV